MDNKKTGILAYGVVRGLIGQVIGTVIGLAFISLLRLVLGMEWNPEPSWVFAMVVGFFGFLIGVGVFKDWFRVARGKEITSHPHDPEEWTTLQRYLGFSVDHKVIGIQYGVWSLLLLTIGGTFALLFRIELASPGLQMFTSTSATSLLGLTGFATAFSLHGIVMIASIFMGVAAMSNYLMPLILRKSSWA